MSAINPSAVEKLRPGHWQTPECPFTIEYPPALLEEIRADIMDAFYSLPRGGAEIGGVLFGRYTGALLKIESYRPLDCEHAFGPSFVLSLTDCDRLGEILASPPDGLIPVGWYHSHTRSEIFLSAKDLEIHRAFFPQPFQVALVLKPFSMKPARAGFFFQDVKGAIQSESAINEFTLAPFLTPQASQARETVDPGPLPIPATAEAAPAPEPPPVIPAGDIRLPPLHTSRFPAKMRKWTYLTMCIFFIGIISVLLQQEAWKLIIHPPKPQTIALQVFDRGNILEIHWDPSAWVIDNALTAGLQINEGINSSIVPLDPVRLRSGMVAYKRVSDHVDIRFFVDLPDGRRLEQNSIFVGKLSPPGTNPGAEFPAPEAQSSSEELQILRERTDKLERRVRQLQQELKVAAQSSRIINQAPE